MRRFVRLLGVIGLTACAASGPQLQPADFPIHARDQVFTLDYRIDREPSRVDAVGLVTSRSTTAFRFVRLNLFGVAADGRVVSRGVAIVDGSFGGPQSFSVRLTPTGDEARFELQVGGYSLGRDL